MGGDECAVTKLGRLWTGAVAYVSLLVGAGLSVAGNLADTYRTRGADIDNLDKVMAAGWPILVLLAIEMFVSPRWSPARMFQAWRWIGCLAVGGMAMVVSWTHLHDLMASRGQLYVVSVLGPLAIDGMAIMATGLILSTRVRRGQVRMVTLAPDAGTVMTKVAGPIADIAPPWMSADMSGHTADTRGRWEMTADTVRPWPRPDTLDGRAPMSADTEPVRGHGRWSDLVATPDTDAMTGQTDVTDWADGHDRAIRDLGQELASEAERYVSATWDMSSAERTAVTPSLPRRTRTPSGASAPDEFVAMAEAWDGQEPKRADMVKQAATQFGVSRRTVSRWLNAVTGAPMSEPSEE